MELWVVMNRDCLVRQSTITNIAVCPADARSCSIKSIEMDSHGCGGIGSCLRKPYGLCRFALEHAHTGSDVLFDHLDKSQPMTRLADQVNGFVMAKVTCHWMVMVVAD